VALDVGLPLPLPLVFLEDELESADEMSFHHCHRCCHHVVVSVVSFGENEVVVAKVDFVVVVSFVDYEVVFDVNLIPLPPLM
jgi:hypothetical protein